MQVSAAEFVLEGLHAHKKIGRNEERVFTAGEKPPKTPRSESTNRKSRASDASEDLISLWSRVVSRSRRSPLDRAAMVSRTA